MKHPEHETGVTGAHPGADRNRRILIVDDNAAIHEDFRKVFGGVRSGAAGKPAIDALEAALFGDPLLEVTRIDYEISSALQGEQAYALVKARSVDGEQYAVAFVDMRMPPGWDGVETIAKIWEIDPEIQIVICTAYSEYSWEQIVARFGVSDRLLILKKPFDTAEVCQLACALTEKWHLARAAHLKLSQLKGMVEDRTRDLSVANLRLSAASDYLEDIYRTMPGSLLVFDRDGKIEVVNEACAALLGYEDGTLVGKHIASIFDAGAVPDPAEIVALATRGEVLRTEKTWLARGGTRIPVLLSATPLGKREDGEWTGIVCVAGDLSDRKRLELELHQAQKLESVGRLAAGVAHEINTPVQFVNDSVHFAGEAVAELAVLIAKYREVTQAVLADVPALEAAQAAIQTEAQVDLDFLLANLPPALERSLEGLGRVATIVRSMKAFAHPDRTEMTASELNPAILATLTVASNELKYVADVETDLGELPLVMCHLGEINQVVLNVAVNAAHAIGDMVRGTDRRGHIRVRTRDHGDSVTIEIEDDGGGIPEAVRHRIFDPFFTTKEVGRGTGQGLAIARSVIRDKHGGELTFTTETGRGTTFTIRLPVAGRIARAA